MKNNTLQLNTYTPLLSFVLSKKNEQFPDMKLGVRGHYSGSNSLKKTASALNSTGSSFNSGQSQEWSLLIPSRVATTPSY